MHPASLLEILIEGVCLAVLPVVRNRRQPPSIDASLETQERRRDAAFNAGGSVHNGVGLPLQSLRVGEAANEVRLLVTVVDRELWEHRVPPGLRKNHNCYAR